MKIVNGGTTTSFDPQQLKRLYHERRSKNLCTTCGNPKSEEYATRSRCGECAQKYNRTKQWYKPHLPSFIVTDKAFAGETHCLRCGEIFHSPDKRLIRFHDSCRVQVYYESGMLGCEEGIYA